MPYLTPERRSEVERNGAANAGELNYLVSRLIDQYVTKNGLSYETIAAVKAGVLGAEQEFHDRFARPYEDIKLLANGEVFTGTAEILPAVLRRSEERSLAAGTTTPAKPENAPSGRSESLGPPPTGISDLADRLAALEEATFINGPGTGQPTGNSACHVHVVRKSYSKRCVDCGELVKPDELKVVNPSYKKGGSKLGCMRGGGCGWSGSA